MACPACSSPLPEGARFCPYCGTPLQVEPGLIDDEERRVVTVLFADLVGFTSLAERRDPERVKRLVDAVFEQLVADIESYGGVVDKILGDAIIALFGAPIAHEDDADRAVRAGLTMQASVRAFRDGYPTDQVRMRVGINTGEVLVGTLAGTDYTAMGDVVNTAARVQELAPVGKVLVAEATRELCSSAIRFEPFDAVQLRGREQSTDLFKVIAVDVAAIGRRWESDVAFVGRRTELEMLRAVISTVVAGRSALVAVAGEAGIGKSRLVREAITPLLAGRPDTVVLEGACAPYGESNVWWPVAGSLLARLRLDRNWQSDDARRHVRRRLAAVAEVAPDTPEFERSVELVLHLLGQPSALDELGSAATRDAVVAGIVAGLRRRAQRVPVVVWVDDLQWSAPVLLELLESVVRQLANLPVLIVTTYRPDEERTSDWPPPVDPALTLHLSLDPLDDREAAELVVEAAGRELPDPVVGRISARSGGNPLFLIELARLAASEDGPTGELPGSLRALIAARLDLLTPSERAVLDNAAIIGNEGRTASLREFAAELGQEFAVDDVRQLEARGLIVLEGSRWRFRSDVVREVAYHTLTKQARAQRHAGVARYLAAFEPGLVDRRAHHVAAAAELRAELGPIPGVPDDVGREAAALLADAARRWNHQGAHRRGLQVIDRALALAGIDGPERRRLLLQRAATLVDLHELRRARARLGELLELAEAAGDRVVWGDAARLLGTVEQMEGDLVAARRELGKAVAEFRRLGDDERLGEALRARGYAEIFGGSLADAEWFLGEADALFERTANARGRAWVLQHRAWVSFLAGDHAQSERRLNEAVASFERLDDRAGRAWSCGLLAYVYHFGGRDDAALDLSATVLDDARQWGDEWGASMMLNLQASIRLWRGDLDEARSLADRSLAGFRRLDDRFGIIQALNTLTRSQVALGRTAEADRSVEEVLVLSGSFGEMAFPAIAAAGAAMHLGHGARAAELAAEAIGRLDTTGANVDEGRVVLAFGHLLRGDADAALAGLLEVDVEVSAFALAARATARAMVGDHAGALADVALADAMPTRSYWDRAIATVAAVASVDGSGSAAARDELAALVDELDDVVISTYASEVLRRLEDHDTSEVDDPVAIPIAGWHEVARRLVAAAPS